MNLTTELQILTQSIIRAADQISKISPPIGNALYPIYSEIDNISRRIEAEEYTNTMKIIKGEDENATLVKSVMALTDDCYYDESDSLLNHTRYLSDVDVNYSTLRHNIRCYKIFEGIFDNAQTNTIKCNIKTNLHDVVNVVFDKDEGVSLNIFSKYKHLTKFGYKMSSKFKNIEDILTTINIRYERTLDGCVREIQDRLSDDVIQSVMEFYLNIVGVDFDKLSQFTYNSEFNEIFTKYENFVKIFDFNKGESFEFKLSEKLMLKIDTYVDDYDWVDLTLHLLDDNKIYRNIKGINFTFKQATDVINILVESFDNFSTKISKDGE
jgi:hypothetical protein